MTKIPVLRSLQSAAVAVALFGAAGSANAVLITTANDTCGTSQRVASLSTSVSCSYESGSVTGTPQAADINNYFGGDWSAAGEVANADGTGGLLTIFLDPGNTWGNGPLSGTWQVASNFWTTYQDGIISMHVGNGSGNPDWFFWELAQGDTSGTFSYTRLNGGGGGLSNLFLWGNGTATSVPEPGSLALLGAGLVGLAWMRRRRKV